MSYKLKKNILNLYMIKQVKRSLYPVKQCLIGISKGGQSPVALGRPSSCRLNGPSYTLDLDMAGHLGRSLGLVPLGV